MLASSWGRAGTQAQTDNDGFLCAKTLWRAGFSRYRGAAMATYTAAKRRGYFLQVTAADDTASFSQSWGRRAVIWVGEMRQITIIVIIAKLKTQLHPHYVVAAPDQTPMR